MSGVGAAPPPAPGRDGLSAPSALLDPSEAVAALARSGIVALTGWPAGPPVLPPWQLAAQLAYLVSELHEVTAGQGRPVRVSWEAAVAGRAVLLGLGRQGQTSPNGSCRLLRTPDGWVALNLPRPSDADLVAALSGRPVSDAWSAAKALAEVTPAAEFVDRGRLLGLATAPLPPAPTAAPGRPEAHAYSSERRWSPGRTDPKDVWQVVDLSSLWAGPLAARILAEAGAAVTKLESATRPDGARATPAFYGWVHPGNETVVQVDLATTAGRQRAATLIGAADVVIEASRPRALEQLGLGPEDHPDRPGRVWLSITGYGRDHPGRDWIAFGDDAAVAGGLVAWQGDGGPVFCGDAIADPLSGLTGALAVLAARQVGGGVLIDLAMSRAAALGATGGPAGAGPPWDHSGGPTKLEPDGTGWRVRVGRRWESVRPGPESLDLIQPIRA